MKQLNHRTISIILVMTFICAQLSFPQQAEKKISKENIPHAEKLIGLEFTDAERDSMLNALNDNLERYNGIHKVKLLNSTPPAILFNPIPVNFKIDQKQKPLKFSSYLYVKMPGNMEDLAYYSI